MAAFTRLEPATDRARSRATSASTAPRTHTSTSFVAPSPSSAIARARSTHREEMAASNAGQSGCDSSSIGAPERPFASRNTASFVLMSSSTVRLLKLARTARRRPLWSATSEAAASVVRKASIVAISGAIMPDPLQNAAIVTSTPPADSVRCESFTRVSVERIASDAASIAPLDRACRRRRNRRSSSPSGGGHRSRRWTR